MNSLPSFSDQTPISPRMLEIPKSATLAINEQSKHLIEQGQDVVRLGLGQSPFPVPDIMISSLKVSASAKDYMTVQGYLPLRKTIAGFMRRTEDMDCEAEDIIIGPCSKELFFGLQMALDCDLVLPAPSWVSYDPQARLLGKQVHWLPCTAQDGWKLTAQTLEQHCQHNRERQQLLVLNSPNNPSGACFSEQELIGLARVAEQYNLIILSDEIYSELHFSGEHLSMARFYPQGTIVSNGISKWAGAGGWRLGYMVFPKQLGSVLDAMIVIASETFTSVTAPIQIASICAFEDTTEIQNYIQACRKIMSTIGLHFCQRLNDQGISAVIPDGGFYNLGDFHQYREVLLKNGISNSADLSRALLDATGVAALPGSDFGLSQGYTLRFAFVDFDGSSLLQKVVADKDLKIGEQTEELKRLFAATDSIGDWLHSL